VGLGRFFTSYESTKHYPEGSIAGLLEAGMRGAVGDDSIARMRQHGVHLRNRSIEEFDAAVSQFDQFQYVLAQNINPGAQIAHNRSSISEFAKTNRLDLVLMSHATYEVRAKGLLGDKRVLVIRLSSQVYDARGEFLGALHSQADEPVAWKFGFDARDPEYLDGFLRVLRSATDQHLQRFGSEIASRR
jgi:hypothetical protein